LFSPQKFAVLNILSVLEMLKQTPEVTQMQPHTTNTNTHSTNWPKIVKSSHTLKHVLNYGGEPEAFSHICIKTKLLPELSALFFSAKASR
jgi:hypothetical protein